MKQKNINQLLDKYYRGETSLEEEALLKDEVKQQDDFQAEEKDIFEYFDQASVVPENLEEQMFNHIQRRKKQPKVFRMAWVRYTSIAAAVCLFASVMWVTLNKSTSSQLTEEQQFAILEQALMQASNVVQPAQNDEMLVLFQDENLEIVME